LGGQAAYAGGFVSHYISAVLYANVSRPFQALLGLLLIAMNVFAYSFVLIRRHRGTGVISRVTPPHIEACLPTVC
jgi:heme O synthase-like polyprenyltransferase